MEKWSEKALFSIAQTYLYFHLKWKTNNNAQRSAQFDSLSGRTSLAVARRTPRYRRNEFQVYFANLEQYFGVFVWLGRWISRTKAKLVYGYKREISSPALPRLMNISALSVQLPRLERNLTCLFIENLIKFFVSTIINIGRLSLHLIFPAYYRGKNRWRTPQHRK
ncbi:Hypothetical_protein [Hexamita inflata]|uniref:Hypothetical_protein n=1 Tax=Hexamita inflata TaxID=28002 RepID=A0ABP1HR09_9EUKA